MAATVGNIAIGFVAATGGFTGGAEKVIKQLGQIKLAGDLVGKAFSTFKETFGRMEVLVDTADRLKINSDALIELRFAADQAGASAAGMDTALEQMVKNVGLASMGTGRAGKSIEAMGLSIDALSKQSPDQMLKTLATAIAGVESEIEQAAIASRIFGDAGMDMLSVLRLGGAGLDAAAAKARSLGLTLGEDAREAAIASDAIERLELAAQAMGTKIIISAAPSINQLSKELEDLTPILADAASGFAKFVAGVLDGSRRLGFILSGDQIGLAGSDREHAKGLDVATKSTAGLADETARLKEEAAALKKEEEEIQDIIGKLNEQANGPESIQDQLTRLGASPEVLEMAKQLEDQIALNKEVKKVEEERAKALQDMADEAARITEKVRTPMEVLNEEMAKLMDLFNHGLIDFATFSRAAADANKDFERSLPRQDAPRSAAFMAEGSAAAFSTANANRTNGLENIARQQLRKQGEAVTAMGQVEAAINNGFKTIHTFAF